MQFSWSGTGKVSNRHQWRLHGDRIPVPAIVSGFSEGELTQSLSEHVYCRPACSKQLFIVLKLSV